MSNILRTPPPMVITVHGDIQTESLIFTSHSVPPWNMATEVEPAILD